MASLGPRRGDRWRASLSSNADLESQIGTVVFYMVVAISMTLLNKSELNASHQLTALPTILRAVSVEAIRRGVSVCSRIFQHMLRRDSWIRARSGVITSSP